MITPNKRLHANAAIALLFHFRYHWRGVGEPYRSAFLRPCSSRSVMYPFSMTQAVAHILEQFEQLTDSERRELRRAIAERVPMTDDLTEDDFAALAAASFRSLDQEEDARRA